MKKRILLAGLGLVLVLGLAKTVFAARDTLLTIQEKRKLVVGMEPQYIPFEYKNEKGEIVGFDVELAKRIAKALGVELEIKEYKWDRLIFALKWQEIDIIVSGMTRTLDRAIYVNFTDPYFQTGQMVILSAKNKSIASVDELDNEKMKIAVVKETTGEATAKAKLPESSLVTLTAENEAAPALLANKVDAFVFDRPFVEDLQIKYPQLKVLQEQLSYELYCFAIDEGDLHFLLWLNYFLADLRLTGEYEKLYNYWFIEKGWKKK